MIITGKEILRRQKAGDIVIDPFDESRLNPNSYNLSLSDELARYRGTSLDMAKESELETWRIPPGGWLMRPGTLYLARTAEYTETHNLVPMLEGRSSVGRLGLYIHVTAGFGDVGFRGYWTLELSCVQPIRIYAGVEIGQIYYHTVEGEISEYGADGKYQDSREIRASQLWKELQKEEDR